MIKKFRCFIFIIALLCISGCDEEDPPNKRVLNVPYYSQVHYTYCAAACIQMWAHYDGCYYSQESIANFIGTWPCGTPPYDVVEGVRFFTFSWGYLAYKYDSVPGAQGDLMGACIEGIEDGTPSMMPFYNGSHSVLVTGFEWHYENNRPIAELMYFNDPDPWVGEPDAQSADDIKDFYFTPHANLYYVILGDEFYYNNGIEGHDDFVLRLGTYYGGPSIYDPKGLLDDLNIDPES